jgi:hypothetical protein
MLNLLELRGETYMAERQIKYALDFGGVAYVVQELLYCPLLVRVSEILYSFGDICWES